MVHVGGKGVGTRCLCKMQALLFIAKYGSCLEGIWPELPCASPGEPGLGPLRRLLFLFIGLTGLFLMGFLTRAFLLLACWHRLDCRASHTIPVQVAGDSDLVHGAGQAPAEPPGLWIFFLCVSYSLLPWGIFGMHTNYVRKDLLSEIFGGNHYF